MFNYLQTRHDMLPRPLGITVLGILHLIVGVVGAFGTVMAIIGTMMSGLNYTPNEFLVILGGAVAFIGIITAVEFAIVALLFSGKRWGRKILIVLSVISFVVGIFSISGNPSAVLGMILDIVVLWYMWRPHVIAYFNGTYSSYQTSPTVEPKNSSLDIIKERYAKGEITKEEFEQKKKDLGA